MGLIEKIWGSYSKKEIKKIMKIVEKIESLEPSMQKLKNEDFEKKTIEYKKRIQDGESLDHLLPEAFALVREAAIRVLGQRHFNVQILGGIILHQGRIAEMKTGEGKTLTVTLSAYLNALTGEGVHIITVNDYLAKFHSMWMGKLYNFLGLSVGLVVPEMSHANKKQAYAKDITYGTNNEFGFDYLRDNMAMDQKEMVQRNLHYAVIDEVDSILIDEARTPLIISGMGEDSTDLYEKTDKLIRKFKPKIIVEKDTKVFDETDENYDYVVDLKSKNTTLTEKGTQKCEDFFNIESITNVENMTILHHINQSLKAYGIMKRDTDYIQKEGQILIVDEFTGRIMQGRRYSEGLHQAIEAKEGVKIASESKTLATITFQNYFRLYKKLAGMTGTAKSEENEFRSIFNLDVVEIPTNKPMIRIDKNDLVYKTQEGKFRAIVEDIKECLKKGQPVLVGTVSIERSEILSKMLKQEKIEHEVLNAKYHEKEAEIIAQAGKYKTVTIATNMAGRGTDILLGGNPEFLTKEALVKQGYSLKDIESSISPTAVVSEDTKKIKKEYKEKEKEVIAKLVDEKEKVIQAGGLKIIGSERHESRRIDNQLRGRSGRQGDPGESRFYISLEDDLMKLFGSERVMSLANMMGLPDDMPIEQKLLTGAIETAQKRVENRNFSIRKNVLEYDDIMNKQRDIIYTQRKKLLDSNNIKDTILNLTKTKIEKTLNVYALNNNKKLNINVNTVNVTFKNYFNITNVVSSEEATKLDIENLTKNVCEKVQYKYLNIRKEFEDENLIDAFNSLERYVMLRVVDNKWQGHIDDMDHLKEGIYLRAYGQTNPIDAYRVESFDLFNNMTSAIQDETLSTIYNIRYNEDYSKSKVTKNLSKQNLKITGYEKNKIDLFKSKNVEMVQKTKEKQEPIRVEKSVGRNEPCPCGSGRKYKKCCGKEE